MAVTDTSDVEMSDQYEDLSPKRQDIIDAWAELFNEESGEPRNVDVADRASANESYSSQTITEHKEIAEARAEQLANQRDEGEQTTTGDPFQGEIPSETQDFQTIQERPTKGQPQQESQRDKSDTQSGYTYEFGPEEIETIVVDEELPETLHSALQREVIQRAFGS